MPGPSMNNMPKLAHNGVANASATSLNQVGMVMSGPIFYSFNIPFASDLAGPDTEDILHATTDAVLRWTHPEDAPDDVPVHELPVHAQNLANLGNLCSHLAVKNDIEANISSSVPKNAKTQVTTRCTTVDISGDMVADLTAGTLKKTVTDTLDQISSYCGVDIFLLGPKLTPIVDGLNGDNELRRDQRWRVAIYGDILSSEHAKTRVLIHIDNMLGRVYDVLRLDTAFHQPLCGRNRKNIKDIVVTAEKIDSILLSRMDKVRKITETNGANILFPVLGSRQNAVRIQATENLHTERTARELMALAGQFYSGFWAVAQADARQIPNPAEIQSILGEVCSNSDADVSFQNWAFSITGSDDAVKAALNVLSMVQLAIHLPYQIKVKIELANEHKEFVSGKKNGKINKIMGQSNVQILFESFGEYNFNIDVNAQSYESMKQGLSLVEQEMPASISFHVPDQYHKRIIGIGGQHIQRIMKKHSVFVKFSNAMDRGGIGREDDDMRVDNVICRTPARNAQNLELVKSEILEMVDRVDSEFTSQIVNVDRLYHRRLIARLPDLETLEKKWNCKISFPSTEQASDEVTVTGPQWQVPQCVDEFLGMVPDNHELVFVRTPAMIKYLESPEFAHELVPKLKQQHEVDVSVHQNAEEKTDKGEPTITMLWTFTRNNAGGLRDAVDFLNAQLTTANVEYTVVKGAIPRPKSDTFEESLQYFDSKLLQHAPVTLGTDSPTKSIFGDEVARERSTLFDRLRKPGSMSSISSFLDRRKNSSQSSHSLFKGSANASKTSLISIESTRSFNADRNPWNDSGVNLTDDDHAWVSRPFSNGIDHQSLMIPQTGEITPRHNPRQSADSGRPSTSHSTNSGNPGHIGYYR
ncbi:hypothetical protein SCUCBS95973_004393 [Sporothrix curviconia]|uniref:K Homology domain-containing protein n=1 Tax=Sporothrix curviconia TaxID=1260050 RepID=A0ABP0BQ03_9PEZI